MGSCLFGAIEMAINKEETVLCPIKEVNVYKWVCFTKCSYYKKGKCPLIKKYNESVRD